MKTTITKLIKMKCKIMMNNRKSMRRKMKMMKWPLQMKKMTKRKI
jgi:hypothetical protein